MKHLSLLSRSLEAALLLAALIGTGSFLYVIVCNMSYPIGFGIIQWHVMESVQRVYEGLPIYMEPSLEYIPELYPPFYYYATALFAFFLGLDLLAGKVVSLLSVLGIGACIFTWLRKEQLSYFSAFLGAALFFSLYTLYDYRNYQVRVDALFCFLLIAGCYLLYHGKSRISAVAASLLFCLSCFTKQSALVVILPVLFAYFLYDTSNRRLDACAAFLGSFAVSVAIYCYISDGWFWYYIFDLPTHHPILHKQWLGFWVTMASWAWPLMLLCAAALYYFYKNESPRKTFLYLSLCGGLFLCSYIMRLHPGGERNTLMPSCMALALFAPMVFARMPLPLYRIGFLLLIGVQFYMLRYNPSNYVPTAVNIEQGKRYLDYLGSIEGDILVEGGGFYPTRIGKKTYNINGSFWDIQRSKSKHLKKKLAREFANAVKQQKFAAIVTYYEDPDKRFIKFKTNYNIAKYYRFKEYIPARLTPEEMQALGEDPSKQRFRYYRQPYYVFVPK